MLTCTRIHYRDRVATHLSATNFEIDYRGRQRCLGQLRRMVDGVAVEHDQLQGTRQLKDALDFRLHLGETRGPAVGAFH